jgi:hypothetical protein
MSGSNEPASTAVLASPAAGPPGRFAELRVLAGPALDYVDPALAYTTESWALLWNVYLPLVTYRHAAGLAGAEIVPALAEQLPRTCAVLPHLIAADADQQFDFGIGMLLAGVGLTQVDDRRASRRSSGRDPSR